MHNYKSKKQYIHIAIDNFTRYVWVVCSKNQTAKDFINLTKLIMKEGKPQSILADRYTAIRSREYTNFLGKNNITIIFTTVDCPQSNGLCERANQTIMTRLRCKFNS